jgi:hypothetical protein
MDDYASVNEDGALHVRLDLRLDLQPIRGTLRTEQGAEEPFVGWLGFAGALERLRQLPGPSADLHETKRESRGAAPPTERN